MSLKFLRQVRGHTDELQKLAESWERLNGAEPRPSLRFHQQLAGRFLSLGEPLLSYDVTQTARGYWRTDPVLRQQQALALARCGDFDTAARLLEALADEGHQDEETLGILGGVYKNQSELSEAPRRRRALMRRARASYESAYAHAQTDTPLYSAINCATTALLCGDTEGAIRWARRATRLCNRQLRASGGRNDYWTLATLGESALIQGRHGAAVDHYAGAVQAAPRDYASHLATRRQALRIARHLKLDDAPFRALFPMPGVVVFAGHMVDRPDRDASARFPPELVDDVRLAIRAGLAELGPVIGYASGASGADLLFLDEVHRAGGQSIMVLPFDPDGFRARSVDGFPGANWPRLYRRALAHATDVVTVAPNQLQEGGNTYLYATQVLRGLAQTHARRTDARLYGMAVFDGKPGDGPGGTATIVDVWSRLARAGRRAGTATMDLHLIDIDALRERKPPRWLGNPAPLLRLSGGAGADLGDDPMRIRSMMFGDVKGFGGLAEEYMPLFVSQFLGLVARTHADMALKRRAHVYNTWGDGLYFVFERVRDAGLFALELNERVVATDWVALGFPHQLQLRLGMHTGPVYPCREPVTLMETCTGTHVSRAARIEPITPPSRVYASREFAAMAEVDGVTEFSCNYVGKVVLPKKSGVIQTYRLDRR